MDVSRCAVVGGGRLGSNLVAALPGIAGPFGRGFDGADCDVVILAVPDREISAAARAIAVRQGRLVGHCSGATSLDALTPHEGFGLHPLMTFASAAVAEGKSPFTGAPAAVGGTTQRAVDTAIELAHRLGMRAFPLADDDRSAYHAAASIASNFLVTVEDAAEVVMRSAGLDRSVLLPLVRTTIDNWERAGRDALTGPVARGDTATVKRQREAIDQRAPELLALFDALVERTRAIAVAPPVAAPVDEPDVVEVAIAAIDAANADDPNRWNGEPLAQAQGRIAHDWVLRLDPAASEALRLAARAHHLRRWAVPRATYPEGRSGYLTWRRDQKARHATELRAILESVGVDEPIVQRATTIVTKRGLGSDPEVQVFEDAVCLTFLETQLTATADRLHDDDHMVAVIAKTLTKMSDSGMAAALTIELDDHGAALVGRALSR